MLARKPVEVQLLDRCATLMEALAGGRRWEDMIHTWKPIVDARTQDAQWTPEEMDRFTRDQEQAECDRAECEQAEQELPDVMRQLADIVPQYGGDEEPIIRWLRAFKDMQDGRLAVVEYKPLHQRHQEALAQLGPYNLDMAEVEKVLRDLRRKLEEAEPRATSSIEHAAPRPADSGDVGPEIEQGKAPAGPEVSHSADFTFVNWGGTEYTFALGVQSSAVQALWDEWAKSGLGLHQDTIRNMIDAERDSFRMDTAFRHHPAFGTMIHRCGDGKYKLALPSAEPPVPKPNVKKSTGITSKSRRKRV